MNLRAAVEREWQDREEMLADGPAPETHGFVAAPNAETARFRTGVTYTALANRIGRNMR